MISVPGKDSHRLVIVGTSNIVSDVLDCAWSCALPVARIITHLPENPGVRHRSLEMRLQSFARLCHPPTVEHFNHFRPKTDEVYALGMTTPLRDGLVKLLHERGVRSFIPLIHPSAYVSPLAEIHEGVFIGAGSVIAPGAVLHPHVFINRGVTIGHDTVVGQYSRIQPGAHVAGLCEIGCGVTVGMSAIVCERLVIGDASVIGAGAIVTRDVGSERRLLGLRGVMREVSLQ